MIITHIFVTITVIITILFYEPISGKNECGKYKNNTLTIAFTFSWTGVWPAGRTIGGAFVVGLEEVRRRNILPGYNIQWQFRDSACSAMVGIRGVIEIWKNVEDLNAIIGPGCSIYCEPVSILAAAWNIPVVSPACTRAVLSKKEIYPTFFRTSSPVSSNSLFYSLACDVFHWQTIGMFTSTDASSTANAIKLVIEASGKNVIYSKIEATSIGNNIIEDNMVKQRLLLRSLKKKVRVIFVIMYGVAMRNFLLSAYDEGMLGGDYVFIGRYSILVTTMISNYRPEMDSYLYNGFLSVELVTHTGPKRKEFARQVIRGLQHSKFSQYAHLSSSADPDQVGDYAGNLMILKWLLNKGCFLTLLTLIIYYCCKFIVVNNIDFQVEYGFPGETLLYWFKLCLHDLKKILQKATQRHTKVNFFHINK